MTPGKVMTQRSMSSPRWPLALLAAVILTAHARAADDLVEFPKEYEAGTHYATVNRGGIREELYTSRDAVQAAKRGEPFPDGTIITLVDYRDGKLFRYVVMEKRKGAGAAYPADLRNGDWRFQEFTPNRSVNRAEDGTRCMRCHKALERTDFVFTVTQMKGVK